METKYDYACQKGKDGGLRIICINCFNKKSKILKKKQPVSSELGLKKTWL